MPRIFTKDTTPTNYMDLGVGAINPLLNGLSKFSVHSRIYVRTMLSNGGTENRALHVQNDSTGATGLILGGNNTAGLQSKVRVRVRVTPTGALKAANGNTDVSNNAWHSMGGVVDIPNNQIRIYLDGQPDGVTGSQAFEASTYTPGTPVAHDVIGGDAAPPNSNTMQVNGTITEIAIWNDDIGDDGFRLLGGGYSANFVSPTKLIFRMYMTGVSSPEVDTKAGKNGTIVGTLASDTDPYYLTSIKPPPLNVYNPLQTPRFRRGFVQTKKIPRTPMPPLFPRRPKYISVAQLVDGRKPARRGFVTYQSNRPRTIFVPTPKTGRFLLAPFDVNETLASKYAGRGWKTPQDQINAGYPYVAQPVPQSGKYVEVFDYGSVLNNVIVNVNWVTAIVAGTVGIQPTLEYSLDASSWSTPVVASSMFIPSFRYLRVTITFTGAN